MENIILILQKTLIFAIPLLIVALGGVFSERSGIINLALEGCMIFGSFIGALFVNYMMKNNILIEHQQIMFVLALLVSGIAGALFSLLLSFAAIKLKSDQTITGTALNLFAPAIFLTICLVFFSQEKVVMPDIPKYVITMENPTGTLLDVFLNKVYISTYIIIVIYIALSIPFLKFVYFLTIWYENLFCSVQTDERCKNLFLFQCVFQV